MSTIDIVGAGVVGTSYAAQLARAGHDVRLVARGARLAQLADGVRVHDTVTGETSTTVVDVAEDARGAGELVIVAVGAHQLAGAAALIPEGDAPVLLLGNGISDMTAGIDPRRAVVGFPGPGGTMRDGVVQRYDVLKGKRFPTTVDMTHAAAGPIARLLEEAGFPVEETQNIGGWRHVHHAFIVAIDGALSLCGGDSSRLSGTPDARVVFARAVKESLEALRRLGHELTPAHLARFRRMPEPVINLLISKMFAGEFAVRRFEAHHRHAVGEFPLLAAQQRAVLDEAGVLAPAARLLCDRVEREGDHPSLLVGSSDVPVNWTPLLGTVMALAATYGLRRARA